MRHQVLLSILLGSIFLLNFPAPVHSAPAAGDYLAPTVNPTSVEAQGSYYISSNGVDPSSCGGGTQANPWRTWAKAEQCVPPGAIIYFMAGTYSNVFSGSSRNKITFAGAPDQPIIIRPAPGDENRVHFRRALSVYGEHGVIYGIDIDANSSYTALEIHQAQDIVIQNSKIHGSRSYDCVHIYHDSDSITLIDNEVYDCGYANASYSGRGDAIDVTGGTNITYRGNHIYNAMRGLQIKGGSLNVVVENNEIHDVDVAIFGSSMGSGIGNDPRLGRLEMHDPAVPVGSRYQAKNVMLRNNLIHNTGAYAAVSPGGWVDYQIYNNTIFNHHGSVVFSITDGSWEFFDSTALAYCGTHACSQCTNYSGSMACVKIRLHSKNGQIMNNIAHTFDRILSVTAGDGLNLEMRNNLYHTQGLTQNTPNIFRLYGQGYSLAQFQARNYEANSFIATPRFTDIRDSTNPNLRLRTTSPAIDHGMPLSDVDQDFTGSHRPKGTSHDIGAYEQLGFKVTDICFLPQFATTYSQLPPRP